MYKTLFFLIRRTYFFKCSVEASEWPDLETIIYFLILILTSMLFSRSGLYSDPSPHVYILFKTRVTTCIYKHAVRRWYSLEKWSLIKQRLLWATHVSKSEVRFHPLICLDTTKFLLISVITLIETFCLKLLIDKITSQLLQRVLYRLTCIVKKRRCWISSLTGVQNVVRDCTY